MGNTRYYTKANGQSFAELTYDAWGMPESPNKLLNNDHGNYVFAIFTGHIYDTTLDIYFVEARFYDANNRTWLAIDLVKDGGNWYQYCYSNPTTYYDPTGQAGFSPFSGCVDVNDLAELWENIQVCTGIRIGYRSEPTGYFDSTGILVGNLVTGSDLTFKTIVYILIYDTKNMPKPKNIGVGTHHRAINDAVAGLEAAKDTADSVNKKLGYTAVIIGVLEGAQESIEEGDDFLGVLTDAAVNGSMDWMSFETAAMIGNTVSDGIASAGFPGTGSLAGGAVGYLVSVGLYALTDKVTFNDYTIREHVQKAIDEETEKAKEKIKEMFS